VAETWLREHGLDDCLLAQEFVTIMDGFDKILLTDNEPGWINRVSTEYSARRAYGLQQAFGKCRRKDDWHKPKNAPASWRSKVDWELLDRFDPRSVETLPQGFRQVEDELRSAMERDAMLFKAKAKLKEHRGGDLPDRLNVA